MTEGEINRGIVLAEGSCERDVLSKVPKTGDGALQKQLSSSFSLGYAEPAPSGGSQDGDYAAGASPRPTGIIGKVPRRGLVTRKRIAGGIVFEVPAYRQTMPNSKNLPRSAERDGGGDERSL
jgi:hypothetical protein